MKHKILSMSVCMLFIATAVPVIGSVHTNNASSTVPGDGTTSTVSHIGSTSDVSLNLTVKITGGLGVNVVVTNSGIVNLTNIPCLIHVEGGILGLINNTVEGIINSIPMGNTTSVGITVLGVGPIRITAKVADEELTATAFVFLIFVLGVQ
jgi:hypothetical protein